MSRPATVDVQIVSYNSASCLRDCLNSLSRCRPDDALVVKVVVLDNNSADGSADLIEAEFPDVRLVRCAVNLGFGQAHNALAEASQADFLLILNPDTVLVGDVVGPLVDTLRRRPQTALVGPRLTYPDGTRQASSQRFPTLPYELALHIRGTKLARLCEWFWDSERAMYFTREELSCVEQDTNTDFLWATCWLIRRDEFLEVGKFSHDFPMYDEDLEFCCRLRARGRRVRYCPGVQVVHIGGASSSMVAKRRMMLRARRRYYRLTKGRVSEFAFAAMTFVFPRLKRVRPAFATRAASQG